MPSNSTLRDHFWRDVAIAAGPRDLDSRAIREVVEDMMRNYILDEVPGFEAESQAEPSRANVPDTNNFSNHTTFAPVFSRAICNALSSSRFCTVRPIFVGPPDRRLLRRRRSCHEPRHHDHFPGGGNPGIQANMDLPHTIAFPTPPVDAAFPWHFPPQLPPWAPNHYVWEFPAGHLAWSPHHQPNPLVFQPLSPWAANSYTGGHPLPGNMPQWTPGTWPPLHDTPIRLSPHIIPNPNNTHLPLIDWNVTKHPSTAKRLTPNHVIVDMASVWDHAVVHNEAERIVVACDVGYLSTLWGPVVIERANEPVRVRDLFDAIYQYFQVPLTYPEVQYILNLHPSNYHRLTDAYYGRCRESVALPGWEAMQGFRRADVLGDRRYWWGVWISLGDGAWWLNLGLVNPSHRERSR